MAEAGIITNLSTPPKVDDWGGMIDRSPTFESAMAKFKKSDSKKSLPASSTKVACASNMYKPYLMPQSKDSKPIHQSPTESFVQTTNFDGEHKTFADVLASFKSNERSPIQKFTTPKHVENVVIEHLTLDPNVTLKLWCINNSAQMIPVLSSPSPVASVAGYINSLQEILVSRERIGKYLRLAPPSQGYVLRTSPNIKWSTILRPGHQLVNDGCYHGVKIYSQPHAASAFSTPTNLSDIEVYLDLVNGFFELTNNEGFVHRTWRIGQQIDQTMLLFEESQSPYPEQSPSNLFQQLEQSSTPPEQLQDSHFSNRRLRSISDSRNLTEQCSFLPGVIHSNPLSAKNSRSSRGLNVIYNGINSSRDSNKSLPSAFSSTKLNNSSPFPNPSLDSPTSVSASISPLKHGSIKSLKLSFEDVTSIYSNLIDDQIKNYYNDQEFEPTLTRNTSSKSTGDICDQTKACICRGSFERMSSLSSRGPSTCHRRQRVVSATHAAVPFLIPAVGEDDDDINDWTVVCPVADSATVSAKPVSNATKPDATYGQTFEQDLNRIDSIISNVKTMYEENISGKIDSNQAHRYRVLSRSEKYEHGLKFADSVINSMRLEYAGLLNR